MCLAIPSRVVSVDGRMAVVERYGERLAVDLMLMAEPVAPGDYLIVQARRLAVERVPPEDAEAAHALFDELRETLT